MPVTVLSLLSEASRRHGVGIVIAAIFAGAVVRMYEDLETKNEVLVSLVREQTSAAKEVSDALRELLSRLK